MADSDDRIETGLGPLEDEERNRTPRSAAGLGTGSGADEPAPITRNRRASAGGWLAVMFIVGAGMLLVALLAEEQSRSAGATALAGVAVLILAVTVVSEVFEPRLVATVGLLLGVALMASGLIPTDHLLPEWGRLVGGLSITIASAGALATYGSKSRRTREPMPRG